LNDISTLFSQGAEDFSSQVLLGLGGGQRPPTISLDNDRFTFIDEAGEKTPHPELKLTVIIIGVNPNPSRLYWGRPFGERPDDPPACFSHNGVGPSIQAVEPQNGTCKGCPKSEWGSAVSNLTGKGIPACSSRKNLAVVVPSHNSSQVWLLSVPIMSFENLKAYTLKLSRISNQGRPVQLCDVETELFVESKKLTFKESAWTNNDAKQTILKIWSEGTAKKVVGANDTPISGLIAPPKKVEQIEAPKQGGTAKHEVLQKGESTTRFDNVAFETKKPVGRPPRKEQAEEIPAFLKSQPSVRGGVVSNPDPVPAGLASALEDAFKLSLE
jgi:hypothetical protein